MQVETFIDGLLAKFEASHFALKLGFATRLDARGEKDVLVDLKGRDLETCYQLAVLVDEVLKVCT